MKQSTFKKLYEEALKRAEEEKKMWGFDVEIALVPVIICKSNGKIGSISGVETSIIFKEENSTEGV